MILESERSVPYDRCLLGLPSYCSMINYKSDPKGYGGIGLSFGSILVFISKALCSTVKTLSA